MKHNRLTSGSKVIPIILPSIKGETFNTESLQGKAYMISFFRFASCPFCNLRIHKLITHYSAFDPDFSIVAIFDSSLKNLRRHANKHQAPFAILADEQNKYYRSYRIEHSIYGVLRGMILRVPTFINGLLKGFIPWPIKGSLTTMPADFLIDKTGLIKEVFYGEDEGDHMPIERIISFSKRFS